MLFFKDLFAIYKIDLPRTISKKRVLLNFCCLYLLSLFSSCKKTEGKFEVVDIQSDIWRSFNVVITAYVRNISADLLMRAYLIQKVATGWYDQKYITKVKGNFTEDVAGAISPGCIQAVEKVSYAFSNSFKGVPQDAVFHWLRTYQFGFTEFISDPAALSDFLENTVIVELGAGVGANTAVHASLSKEGVFVFDIPPMLKLQKQTIGRVAESLQMSDVRFFSDPEVLMRSVEGKRYIVISYWAFTEFPISLRDTLKPLIKDSEATFIASNSVFEGTDNKDFLEAYASELQRKLDTKRICWSPYRNHFYAFIGGES